MNMFEYTETTKDKYYETPAQFRMMEGDEVWENAVYYVKDDYLKSSEQKSFLLNNINIEQKPKTKRKM